jgi:dipeptidyl aminopeptidase/acylaminoacyl peptidase
MRIALLLFLLFRTIFPFFSQERSALKLPEIMKGNEFVGYQPESMRWSVEGSTLYFDWNPTNEAGNSTYSFQLKTKDAKAIKANGLLFEFDPAQANFTDHYQLIEGALYRYDRKTKVSTLIYQSMSPVTRIFRGKEQSVIYFECQSNLHKYDRTNGAVTQITQFKKGKKPADKNLQTTLGQTEEELFLYWQQKKVQREWRKNVPSQTPPPGMEIYSNAASIEQIQIDPSGHFVSFRASDYPQNEETNVPNYLTTSGHTKEFKARPKVGENEPTHRLGIGDLTNDTVYWIDFSRLSDIRKKPAFLTDTTTYTEDRKIVMHELVFHSNQPKAVCDIRSYDNKDRWIVLIDLPTGKYEELDHQHDEAWIGGPGISSWNTEAGTLGWLKDGDNVYFQSEKTGYSHLYLISVSTRKISQLTKGNWEVHTVTLSQNGEHFYIQTNTTNPGDRNFYRYDIKAMKMVPLLTKSGYYEVELSPDEKTLALRYSFKNKPWEIYTSSMDNPSNLTQLTDSRSPAFKTYNWREPEVISFNGSDGKDVFARLYQPNPGQKNGAAVLFVHGAGYLQNAHNYWSTYHREYMFHNLLVDQGFTVLDIDYRASEGYGRDYRTAIYRHMGGRDLQDQLDGKRLLVEKYGIDSSRVGIYGGSYGGFITLMALFTSPGQFTCGAALRSVTDWAHYNHEYTSNILNYPDNDPEAYRKSSPIFFADGLQDRLLILHGMVDDNVQFQDVVRLNQRLIELGKQNWEMAVYPIEAHGFKESSSWTDEYTRIYNLFNEVLLKPTRR